MLFLVTGSEKELKEVARELGRIFLAGFHPDSVVALEIVRRHGAIHEVAALSASKADGWRKAHKSTLSALPWRYAVLSDGTEWRTETAMSVEVFLDLHRANYVPIQCIPARYRPNNCFD